MPQSIFSEMASGEEQKLTLYESWLKLNDDFLFNMTDDEFLLAGRELPRGREFSYMTYNVTLSAKGFGLPESNPFLKQDRRIKLLRGRYVHDILWKEALQRLKEKGTKSAQGPMSYVMPFYRTKSTPTGGGCLISLVFSWYNRSWKIHVMSRASEITIRLLGDMYFMESLVGEILAEIPLKNWPGSDNVQIDWTLLMCSQMKHVMPYYLLHTRGEDFFKEYVLAEPQHLRHLGIIEYFWGDGTHPERVNWQQRRKWTDKFLAEAKGTDWVALSKEYWATYEERTGKPLPAWEAKHLQSDAESVIINNNDIIPVTKPRKIKILRKGKLVGIKG